MNDTDKNCPPNEDNVPHAYKQCRFWSYHRKCFLTYDEWIKETWDDEQS